MKKNLIKKISCFLVVCLMVTACFCACSHTQTVNNETTNPQIEQVQITQEEVLRDLYPVDEKAPEGTLLTYFLASSETVLPEYFIENVTDETPVVTGFRNIQLLSDDPSNLQLELPEWTMEKDCYEETDVEAKDLRNSFYGEKDGLYSMEVVGVDGYGNASVATVYVLFVTEDVSAAWLENSEQKTSNIEKSSFTGFDRAKAEQAFSEINNQRMAHGLMPISWDEGLYELACVRATEIVDSFSHQRPDGTYVGDVVIRQYGASGCGENIAMNYQSISNLINGWLNSTGHRETMLDVRFSMGVMACYCHDGTYYWVNLFKQ